MQENQMHINKTEDYTVGDFIQRLVNLLTYVRKKSWLLLLFTLVGIGGGLLYYSLQRPKYEAVSSFILEEKQGGMGGLSSLASQFGFDFGAIGGGGSLFAGDNILDILKSKKVVQATLLSPVDKDSTQTLGDLFLDFSGWKAKWRRKGILQNFPPLRIDGSMTPVEDSVLSEVYKDISEHNLSVDRVNKKGTIIRVAVSSPDLVFSRLMAMRLVNEAGKMYLAIKTGNAQNNIDRLQQRSDSLLALLNRKSYAAAASQPLDINPGLRTAAVPVEIASRDKAVIATLYTEVTKNLEASKMILSQQTPVMQLLDQPPILMSDNKKSFLFLMITGAFISTVLGFVFIVLLFFLHKTNSKHPLPSKSVEAGVNQNISINL